MRSDPAIRYVIAHAKVTPWVDKVVLFGSRARGDHHDRSDYDVAVQCTPEHPEGWAAWALDLKESVPTLGGLDIVLVHANMSGSLKQAIQNEGVVIYDRQGK